MQNDLMFFQIVIVFSFHECRVPRVGLRTMGLRRFIWLKYIAPLGRSRVRWARVSAAASEPLRVRGRSLWWSRATGTPTWSRSSLLLGSPCLGRARLDAGGPLEAQGSGRKRHPGGGVDTSARRRPVVAARSRLCRPRALGGRPSTASWPGCAAGSLSEPLPYSHGL